MVQHVLITGGTGVVGSHLTQILLERGFEVSLLSRRKDEITHVKVFEWDTDRSYIEPGALENADYIIHLAGAGVADKRWTSSRKKEIIESRTRTAQLLNDHLQKVPNQVKALISASAIGYYGADTGNILLSEEAPPGNDFLASVCQAWEESAWRIYQLGIRTVIFRIGFVLSNEGGALPRLVQPIKVGAGTVLGSGKQYVSWIHIDDLCQMFIQAMENIEMQGVYNAVAPHPVTNEELTKQTAEVLHKSIILPNAPAFALKLAFGEMAEIVLGGNRVSNEKIINTGFSYQYPELKPALASLLQS